MFVRVVTRCFLSARHHSSIGFPTHGIRSLLVAPAFERLTKSGATIRTETSVSQIRFDAHRVTGVQLQSGNTLVADWYVAALPHRRLCSLLPEGTLAHYGYFEQLTRLTDSPAVTVHLWVDRALPAPRLGISTGGGRSSIREPPSFGAPTRRLKSSSLGSLKIG